MREAFVVSAVRTAVGKSNKGTLRNTRPDDLGATVVRSAVDRVPGFDPKFIEDVILGCAMPEGEQGMNLARMVSLRAGLPTECAAMTINRYCASGLQSIAIAADRIRSGGAEAILAGGVESMSYVPMGGNKVSANPWLIHHRPSSYLSMGLTAEKVAEKYGINRDNCDEFAYRSHRKALSAIAVGAFKEEIVPVAVSATVLDEENRPVMKEMVFSVDEGPRADPSLEALAKLRPVFHASGIVTAGNSSQTSDGAAATIVVSGDCMKKLGLKPIARFVSFAYAGCDPEIMGIGPIHAVPKALKLAGLTLDDIDLIELNEAFATQAIAVIQTLGMDPDKVNVNGGAIALGHPLGCTGTKLTTSLIYEMGRRKARYGLVTMCVGGGMGAAGIFENLQNNPSAGGEHELSSQSD